MFDVGFIIPMYLQMRLLVLGEYLYFFFFFLVNGMIHSSFCGAAVWGGWGGPLMEVLRLKAHCDTWCSVYDVVCVGAN